MPLTRNFKGNFEKSSEKLDNVVSFLDNSIGKETNRNLLSLGDNEFIEVERILGKNKKY
jgi:hypothetical protein